MILKADLYSILSFWLLGLFRPWFYNKQLSNLWYRYEHRIPFLHELRTLLFQHLSNDDKMDLSIGMPQNKHMTWVKIK